ncbi:hypothetical protein WA158_003477 [Blastocystis sp. Blastoise]
MNSYPPELIFNMDESWYIKKKSEIEDHVTVVCCVSNADDFSIPMFIVPFKTLDIKSTKEYNLSRITIANSESCWMTKSTFLQWIESIFIKFVDENRNNDHSRRALLLLDGHESLNIVEVWKLLKKNNIDCITFLAYSTQFLQPLDHIIYSDFKSNLHKEFASVQKIKMSKDSQSQTKFVTSDDGITQLEDEQRKITKQ